MTRAAPTTGPTSDEKTELAPLRRDKARLEKEVRLLESTTAYVVKGQR